MQQLPPFDELKALAEQDPDKLEALRQSLAEELIQSSSPEMQPRLRAQQSHINQVISQGKNPIHTNVLLRKELQKQLHHFATALTHPESLQQNQAKVYAFKPKAMATED